MDRFAQVTRGLPSGDLQRRRGVAEDRRRLRRPGGRDYRGEEHVERRAAAVDDGDGREPGQVCARRVVLTSLRRVEAELEAKVVGHARFSHRLLLGPARFPWDRDQIGLTGVVREHDVEGRGRGHRFGRGDIEPWLQRCLVTLDIDPLVENCTLRAGYMHEPAFGRHRDPGGDDDLGALLCRRDLCRDVEPADDAVPPELSRCQLIAPREIGELLVEVINQALHYMAILGIALAAIACMIILAIELNGFVLFTRQVAFE